MRVDMCPDAIGERLRGVAALSTLDPSRRLEAKIDMAPDAIARRIRKVAELRRLCALLAGARPD